jgi:hypothetical protein
MRSAKAKEKAVKVGSKSTIAPLGGYADKMNISAVFVILRKEADQKPSDCTIRLSYERALAKILKKESWQQMADGSTVPP